MSVISFLGNSHITVILTVATGTECLLAVCCKTFWSAVERSLCFWLRHWLLLPPLACSLKCSLSAQFKIGFTHLGWPFPLTPVLYPGSSVSLMLRLVILFSSAVSLRLNLLHFLTCPFLTVTRPESPVLLTCFYQSKSKDTPPLYPGRLYPCPVLSCHFIPFLDCKHSQSNSLALLCLSWFFPVLEWMLVSAPGSMLV